MSVVWTAKQQRKTFWAADLALHIVSGRSWNGREMEQGAVIWLAMEGAFGISNRIAAGDVMKQHGDCVSLSRSCPSPSTCCARTATPAR